MVCICATERLGLSRRDTALLKKMIIKNFVVGVIVLYFYATALSKGIEFVFGVDYLFPISTYLDEVEDKI